MSGADARVSDAIRLTVAIAVAPDVLWSVLTGQDHLERWWGYARLTPVVGGTFRETWRDGGRDVVTAGTVLVADPPHLLVLDWADDDWPGATRLSFSIAARPDGTSQLELVHDGWEVHPPDRRMRLVESHAAGWRHHLRNLTAYAEALTRGEA